MGKHAGVGYTPGSDPSRITAEDVAEYAPNQRAKIWFWLRDRGVDYGGTHDEAVQEGLNASTGGSRMSELKDLGRITELLDAGGKHVTRPTEKGKPAGAWIALPFEDWKDKRPDWPAPEKSRSPRSRKSRLRYAKKSFYEILDRLDSPGLFSLTEIEAVAKRALDVIG